MSTRRADECAGGAEVSADVGPFGMRVALQARFGVRIQTSTEGNSN